MKARTTAQTAMISAALAIAVMAPATQAQAGFLGDVGGFLDGAIKDVAKGATKAANSVANEVTKAANSVAKETTKVSNTIVNEAEKIARLALNKPATRPNMNMAWNSAFGKIHFSQGFYGNKNKTLKGRLINVKGVYVYSGQFGRKTNKSVTGGVTFVFSHNGKSFKGSYISSQNGQVKPWNGNR